MKQGLRTYLRKWDPARVADLPGGGSQAIYLLRYEFLCVVDSLFPEVLKELGTLDVKRSRVQLRSPGLEARIAEVLSAHRLSAPWITDAARATLSAWRSPCATPGAGWYARPSLLNDPGQSEMESGPLEWHVIQETENDLRARFEAFVRRRKEEAFRAGYAQVLPRTGRPSKVSVADRLRMLALHVVGGMTYRAIADELAEGFDGRRVELTESAVQQHIAKLASAIELPLPPRRGRRSTTERHASADERAADLGGGPVGLSHSEVRQLAKLAGPLKLRPLTESEMHQRVATLGEGLRLPPPSRSGRRSTTRK